MKTEKEKMLAGEPYDCADGELQKRWHIAKDLIREFNQTDTRNKERIEEIFTELFGSCGKGLAIAPPFFCDYGQNIHIGNNTEINHNCVFLDCNRITIGSNVLIAPSVQLLAAYHPIKASDRMPRGGNGTQNTAFCMTQSKPITIEDEVWIRGGVIVLPGVTIGRGTVIGAGSVVTRDIPPHVIAFGNPCRVVRQIEQ